MGSKRMGGMSLGSFSKSSAFPGVEIEEVPSKIKPIPGAKSDDGESAFPGVMLEEIPSKTKPIPGIKTKPKGKPAKNEALVTVNIKITESQQEWLADTAKQVRRNNNDPVAASDRVYPQHLIQSAIDLLKDADIKWSEVRNVEDLRKTLGL